MASRIYHATMTCCFFAFADAMVFSATMLSDHVVGPLGFGVMIAGLYLGFLSGAITVMIRGFYSEARWLFWTSITTLTLSTMVVMAIWTIAANTYNPFANKLIWVGGGVTLLMSLISGVGFGLLETFNFDKYKSSPSEDEASVSD